MGREARWFFGALMGVLALVGLVLAAYAQDKGIYYAGLALSVCATLYIFLMIKRAYDRPDEGS